jgi:hypothetical protein
MVIRQGRIGLGYANSGLQRRLKHFQGETVEPQVSPLRFASVEMTKGRAAVDLTIRG